MKITIGLNTVLIWMPIFVMFDEYFQTEPTFTSVVLLGLKIRKKYVQCFINYFMSLRKYSKRALIDFNREYMNSLIDITQYLATQGLAFRGHDENKTSLNQDIFIKNKIINILSIYYNLFLLNCLFYF